MTSSPKCCDTCFAMIAEYCVSSAKLWLNLCQLDRPFYIFNEEDLFEEDIRMNFLEKCGFVLTTETEDKIFLKLLGRKTDAFGTYFCCGKCCDERI